MHDKEKNGGQRGGTKLAETGTKTHVGRRNLATAAHATASSRTAPRNWHTCPTYLGAHVNVAHVRTRVDVIRPDFRSVMCRTLLELLNVKDQ